jgi:hypothetical protein
MKKEENKVRVGINPNTYKKLEALWEEQIKYSSPSGRHDSVNVLINYIMGAVVDGVERSGSWEREVVERMGLIPNDNPLEGWVVKNGQTQEGFSK